MAKTDVYRNIQQCLQLALQDTVLSTDYLERDAKVVVKDRPNLVY